MMQKKNINFFVLFISIITLTSCSTTNTSFNLPRAPIGNPSGPSNTTTEKSKAENSFKRVNQNYDAYQQYQSNNLPITLKEMEKLKRRPILNVKELNQAMDAKVSAKHKEDHKQEVELTKESHTPTKDNKNTIHVDANSDLKKVIQHNKQQAAHKNKKIKDKTIEKEPIKLKSSDSALITPIVTAKPIAPTTATSSVAAPKPTAPNSKAPAVPTSGTTIPVPDSSTQKITTSNVVAQPIAPTAPAAPTSAATAIAPTSSTQKITTSNVVAQPIAPAAPTSAATAIAPTSSTQQVPISNVVTQQAPAAPTSAATAITPTSSTQQVPTSNVVTQQAAPAAAPTTTPITSGIQAPNNKSTTQNEVTITIDDRNSEQNLNPLVKTVNDNTSNAKDIQNMSQDDLKKMIKEKFPQNKDTLLGIPPAIVRRNQGLDNALSTKPTPNNQPNNPTGSQNPPAAVPPAMPQAVVKIIEDQRETGISKLNIVMLEYYYKIKNKLLYLLNIADN